MCGIAGYLQCEGASGRVSNEIILAMTQVLQHRGPDGEGCWVDEQAGIAIGHRRLAIQDLSEQGHQPMFSESGRYIITYNGEIYNFSELGEELKTSGHQFRGHSDTEVVLAAIEQWGVETAVQRFIGMFAFALWDRVERCLYLGRDPVGKKPLYYGYSNKDFVFGSELKALLIHSGFKREIDQQAQRLFLQYGFIPGPLTIFRGISKLLPGCILRIDANNTLMPVIKSYWTLDEVVYKGVNNRFSGSETESLERLEYLLNDSVRLRLRADVPLGVFLSGGIDSSLVAALAQKHSEIPVRTFSIGFDSADYNEAIDASRVAKHLGCEHTEHYMGSDDVLRILSELPTAYDEPFSDISQIPTLLVSRLAREYVTVAMSGDGGDELFGGYNRHVMAQRYWVKLNQVPLPVRRLIGFLPKRIPACWLDTLVRIFPGLKNNYRNPVEKFQKALSALEVSCVEGLYRTLLTQENLPKLDLSGQCGIWPDNIHRLTIASEAEHFMYWDTQGYLPDDILTKVDRASMHESLEVRSPLLDRRLVEFSWSLPIEFKIKNGVGKYPLKSILAKYLPRELFERPKMGFAVPIDDWLRSDLREWAGDIISSESSLPGYQSDIAKRYWNEHISARRNRGRELWSMLVLLVWRRQWM